MAFKLKTTALLTLACLASAAHAVSDKVKVGLMLPYTGTYAALGTAMTNGFKQYVEENGGKLGGREVEYAVVDDESNPAKATENAKKLVSREKVDVLAGAFLSNTGLALTDFAKQKKFFYLAAEPLTDKIVWSNGNRYTYRLRPSTYMQVAMLVPEAAKMKKKRWAIVYPNYEYGQSSVATFKQLLKAAQPDVEFVAEQAPPLGKVDAGSVVQALADAQPDAIFNVLFATDLAKFVREGNTRGLFRNRPVASLLTGEPEYLDPLKDETPEGWVVTGYPWYAIKTPEHQAFLSAYQARFKDYPRVGSVVGYNAIKSLAEGMKKAGGTDTEKLIAAFRGLQLSTPFGPMSYRSIDHQATMGVYVGVTKKENGKGVMANFRYLDGAKFQPSDAEVRKLRPSER